MARKSNKLKIKKLQINFTDKWFYTFVVVISLIIIGVGVYALTPGGSGDPGHNIDSVGPPSGCVANEYLQWDGSVWTCAEGGSGGDMSNVAFTNISETFDENLIIAKNLTVDTDTLFVDSTSSGVGIGTLDPGAYRLSVNGDLSSTGPIHTEAYGIFKQGIILGDNSEECDTNYVGMLRYTNYCAYDDIRKSFFDICMKINDSFYEWHTLKFNAWEDLSCDTNGCPFGQTYYVCTWGPGPGCYDSEPEYCFYEPPPLDV